MNGWLYLIRNGDLYKIGITRNFNNRMRQLKPDSVILKLYSREFKELERELHKRYSNVRIPQTEYFRLDHKQIKEIKERITRFYYPKSVSIYILCNSIILLAILLLLSIFSLSLIITDANQIKLVALNLMELIAFCLSILSLFIKSDKYFSFYNELRFRFSKFIIYFSFAIIFRLVSRLLF